MRCGLQLLHRVRGVVQRRDDEVLEALDVVRVDRLGLDLQAQDVTAAAQRGRDEAAAGRALDDRLGQLLLRRRHLLLHLLGLLHQLLHVGLAAWLHAVLPVRRLRPSLRAGTDIRRLPPAAPGAGPPTAWCGRGSAGLGGRQAQAARSTSCTQVLGCWPLNSCEPGPEADTGTDAPVWPVVVQSR